MMFLLSEAETIELIIDETKNFIEANKDFVYTLKDKELSKDCTTRVWDTWRETILKITRISFWSVNFRDNPALKSVASDFTVETDTKNCEPTQLVVQLVDMLKVIYTTMADKFKTTNEREILTELLDRKGELKKLYREVKGKEKMEVKVWELIEDMNRIIMSIKNTNQ
jgi:hypothetical protein